MKYRNFIVGSDGNKSVYTEDPLLHIGALITAKGNVWYRTKNNFVREKDFLNFHEHCTKIKLKIIVDGALPDFPHLE